METAGRVRDEVVGRSVKLMCTIGIITPCSVNPPCAYCSRAADPSSWGLSRVLSDEELEVAVNAVRELGVTRVWVGGGTLLGEAGRELTLRKLKVICGEGKGLEVWLNNGPSYTPDDVPKIKELGVHGICCSYESVNESVLKAVRPGIPIKLIDDILTKADEVGLAIANVMQLGLGEGWGKPHPYGEWVDFLRRVGSYRNLRHLNIHPHRPVPGTPSEGWPPGSEAEVLKMIAIARLMFRDIYISSTADSVAPFLAGANLLLHAYMIGRWRGKWVRGARVRKLTHGLYLTDNTAAILRSLKDLSFSVEY